MKNKKEFDTITFEKNETLDDQITDNNETLDEQITDNDETIEISENDLVFKAIDKIFEQKNGDCTDEEFITMKTEIYGETLDLEEVAFSTQIIEDSESDRIKMKEKLMGKKKKQNLKRNKLIKKALAIFFVSMFFVSVLVLAFLFYGYNKAYNSIDDVNKENFFQATSTTNIYDRNEDFVMALGNAQNIDWIDLYDVDGQNLVAQSYLDALIATEDEDFYTHNGINLVGMVKATLLTLFTDVKRGGSTLTMQAGKLIFMKDWEVYEDDMPTNKFQEPIKYKFTQMAYATHIEENFTKDEILENYINIIYLGNGAHGIKNASNYYYGKEPIDLEIHESAFLAGVSQLPSFFDPYTNPEDTLERRNVVLIRMLDEGYITEEEYEENILFDITEGLIEDDKRVFSASTYNAAYIDVVGRELEEIFNITGDSPFVASTAGVNVYTNLDPIIQKHMYESINKKDALLYEDDYIQAGAVILDTQNAEILGIGSGRNGHNSYGGTNFAYNYTRQPGSTAKPIMDYGPAMEELDWSTGHVVHDQEIEYDGGSEVTNADGKYLGPLTMQSALSRSRNTTALEVFKIVAAEAGLQSIMNFATGLGITDINPSGFNQAYSIGGWDYGTTPIELAGAYASFGNGGTYYEPHTITRVEINKVSPYYKDFGDEYVRHVESRVAMKPETAYMMNDMLDFNKPEAAGLGGYVNAPFDRINVKTGTTNWDERSEAYGIPNGSQRDKWVVGYNEKFTSVTWNGYTQEQEQEGYYIGLNTQNPSNAFSDLISIFDEYMPDYFTTVTPQKPETVVTEKISIDDNGVAFIDEEDGVPHLYIVDSKDHEMVMDGKSPNTPDSPILETTISNNGASIRWSYSGDNRETASWIIYIDGIEYKAIEQTSIAIPTIDFFLTTNICSDTYQVGIETVQENENGDSFKSEVSITDINFVDDSFCFVEPEVPEIEVPDTDPPIIFKFNLVSCVSGFLNLIASS